MNKYNLEGGGGRKSSLEGFGFGSHNFPLDKYNRRRIVSAFGNGPDSYVGFFFQFFVYKTCVSQNG